MELTNEEFDLIKERLSSKSWRMSNLYYIKDKQGKEVIFKPNPVQLKYEQNKRNKNIILKARQQGFTTYECINALDSCLFNSNYDAGIIAHTVDDAEKIFTNKVKFAFDRLPQIIRTTLKPNNDRAGELRFPNGSSISVSAGFRGGTLMKLHVSEYGKICAKYPDKAKEIRSGAFNAVPLHGDLTIESTAEGMSGEYYELWGKSEPLQDSELTAMDYKAHFFPWHESSEYRLNPVGIKISEDINEYFRSLELDHGIKLDDWQKAWYFKKSLEQDEVMKQEFPSFSEESFMASGRPVFNRERIARDIKRAKDHKSELKTFAFKSNDKTHKVTVKLFKQPQELLAYSIGADVAEGLEDGDSSTAAVYNKDFEMMAVYEGKLDPDIFGEFLVELGLYYNSALLVPELNNHGHATLAAIKRRNYYHVYRRVITEELADDTQDKIGWLNTSKSKMKMLDDFKAAYRDDSLKIHCEHTLRQMMTLSLEEDGNIILNGKDLCVATGLAIQGLSQAIIPGTNGAFESSGNQVRFKTLGEMLKHSTDSEESYFD